MKCPGQKALKRNERPAKLSCRKNRIFLLGHLLCRQPLCLINWTYYNLSAQLDFSLESLQQVPTAQIFLAKQLAHRWLPLQCLYPLLSSWMWSNISHSLHAECQHLPAHFITRAKIAEDSSHALYWPQLPSGRWCPGSGKCVFQILRNWSVKGPWFLLTARAHNLPPGREGSPCH